MNINSFEIDFNKYHSEVKPTSSKEVNINGKGYIAKKISVVLHSVIAFFSKKNTPSNRHNCIEPRKLSFKEFNESQSGKEALAKILDRKGALEKSLYIEPRKLSFKEFNESKSGKEALAKILDRKGALEKSLYIEPRKLIFKKFNEIESGKKAPEKSLDIKRNTLNIELKEFSKSGKKAPEIGAGQDHERQMNEYE